MKVKFPAMQATIGQRIYYVCAMKLSAIPKMFTLTDWIGFTAEDREQRVLRWECDFQTFPPAALVQLQPAHGGEGAKIYSWSCKTRL